MIYLNFQISPILSKLMCLKNRGMNCQRDLLISSVKWIE